MSPGRGLGGGAEAGEEAGGHCLGQVTLPGPSAAGRGLLCLRGCGFVRVIRIARSGGGRQNSLGQSWQLALFDVQCLSVDGTFLRRIFRLVIVHHVEINLWNLLL